MDGGGRLGGVEERTCLVAWLLDRSMTVEDNIGLKKKDTAYSFPSHIEKPLRLDFYDFTRATTRMTMMNAWKNFLMYIVGCRREVPR